MLEREQAYFEAHKEYLREHFLGKRVLIADDEVKGSFDTDGEAYQSATQKLGLKPGTFMIKPIKATDDESIQRYMNRVYA